MGYTIEVSIDRREGCIGIYHAKSILQGKIFGSIGPYLIGKWITIYDTKESLVVCLADCLIFLHLCREPVRISRSYPDRLCPKILKHISINTGDDLIFDIVSIVRYDVGTRPPCSECSYDSYSPRLLSILPYCIEKKSMTPEIFEMSSTREEIIFPIYIAHIHDIGIPSRIVAELSTRESKDIQLCRSASKFTNTEIADFFASIHAIE